MFLLENLKTNEIKIVEDVAQRVNVSYKTIDMAAYKIEAFKSIKDPLAWQQEIRSEWN